MQYFFRLFLLFLVFQLGSCSLLKDKKSLNQRTQNKSTLIDSENLWTADTLDKGLIYYNFTNYYAPQKAFQHVNVVEIDPSNKKYYLDFIDLLDSDSEILSKVAAKEKAIVGINASYELDVSFIKTKGKVKNEISIEEGHLRSWKYEGAIFYNSDGTLKIDYGTNQDYLNSAYENIYSGSPMLIYNFEPIGRNFVGDITDLDLSSLPYEDYRRHQGVRHPRTVYAITKHGHLLLITIDGRFTDEAEGMTAKETTEFLTNFFQPRYALNMDGGGSTSLYIKEGTPTGIVNYPTDNGKRDHKGERPRYNFILIKKKEN